MTTTVLVLNAGSSSLKFALFDMQQHSLMMEGIAERLNADESCIKFSTSENESAEITESGLNHKTALEKIIQQMKPYPKPQVVGHRVVHGGEYFREAVIINDQVIEKIEACIELAPLHNPANLIGIQAAVENFVDVPQVAIFDTAFHASLPEKAYLYALPYDLYKEQSVRRYGFHGTSHQYVSQKAAQSIEEPIEQLNMVVAHLGNGCSATAVAAGKSVDTTMGMTPLEGLVMGTRSGSIDPAILLYLTSHKNMTIEEVDQLLNKKSGLLGLSGLSNDMRTLEQARLEGHQGAAIAIDVFCYRLAKHIAALLVSLKSFDALVFTGGIGENSSFIREKTCEQLEVLGVFIDASKNQNLAKKSIGKISCSDSTAQVWVVPTNEELMIAKQSIELISA